MEYLRSQRLVSVTSRDDIGEPLQLIIGAFMKMESSFYLSVTSLNLCYS